MGKLLLNKAIELSHDCYKIILDCSENNIEYYKKLRLHNPPTTLEQSYYRYLYNKNYNGTDHIIPYFWMPKFVEANDASARTLKLYDEINEN